MRVDRGVEGAARNAVGLDQLQEARAAHPAVMTRRVSPWCRTWAARPVPARPRTLPDPRSYTGRMSTAPLGSAAPIGDFATAWPAADRPELLAAPVAAAVPALSRRHAEQATDPGGRVLVVDIDPEVADTAAFCERYGVSLQQSANCVVVAAKRAGQTSFAACVVLAHTRADVNTTVRRHLGARKASFAPRESAIAETGMEFGGITPIGLPDTWPLLIDSAVLEVPWTVIGSGVRRSKLLVPGALLAELHNAEVIKGLAG